MPWQKGYIMHKSVMPVEEWAIGFTQESAAVQVRGNVVPRGGEFVTS